MEYSNIIIPAEKPKQPQSLIEATHLTTDLIQGDEKAFNRLEDFNIDYEELNAALELILKNDTISESKKRYLMSNSWRIHYRTRPPSIEEFLTEEWIGPTADSIFPHVREILCDFWQPMSPYRNLILAASIGTGKALPDSSPVVIDEIPTIEIELENGTILSFDEDDDVWIYCPDLTKIKAKDLFDVETKDFPVLPNYYNMKIYNAEKVPEFKEAFSLNNYDSLIEFFRGFNSNFYSERNIYIENHHIIPRSEGGTEDPDNMVYLPFYFHVKAHYLRAKEHEEMGNRRDAFKNYLAVRRCLHTDKLPEKELDVFNRIQLVSESIEKTKSLQTSQFFIKRGDEPSFKIFEEEWDFYEAQGWEKGRNFNTPADKKWVNKDNKNYYVPKEEVELYLDAGYQLGMFVTEKMKESNPSKASYSTLNTKWVNKDGERKCVSLEEVEEYLRNGWKLGSASETNKGLTWEWSEEQKGRKIFNDGKKEVWAYECPEGFQPGKRTKGKRWFTDGETMIIADTCPEGFKPGRVKSDKKYYTNGINNAFLTEYPEGWWRGRTIASKKNK